MGKKQQMPKPINTSIYRYRQALYMAFYSSRLYVDVAKRWRGFCFSYLLLLIAIAAIPFSVHSILDINHYLNDKIISPVEKIPTLHIKNGELLFDKPMPYIIKDKAGSAVIMIDTQSNVTGMDAAYPELMILITKNKIYFRVPEINYFLKKSENVAQPPVVKMMDKNDSEIFVSKEWVKSIGLLRIKWFFRIMFYPLTVSFLFGLCCTLVLVLTMIAQTISLIFLKYTLSFKEAARMLIVASTAPVFVFLLLLSVNGLFPEIGFVCAGLYTIYFCYGVLAIKRECRMMVAA